MIYPGEALTGFWYVTYPDYAEMRFMEAFLRADDRFFDVGANAGGMAVFAASLGCRVTAFEPVPSTYRRLVENAVLNATADRIETKLAAISDRVGKMSITTHLGPCNRKVQPGENSPSVEIETTTIDEQAGIIGIPCFMKIDVEGHEYEVLLGAEKTLASDCLAGLVMETFRAERFDSSDLRRIERLLEGFGFLPYDYDPIRGCLIPLKETSEGGNDTIYLRDNESTRRRLIGQNAT